MLRFVILCFTWTALLFWFSAAPEISANFTTDTQVSVTAQVPVSSEHILGVKKNSRLLDKPRQNIFQFKDSLQYTVQMRGLGDEPLKNRSITLQLRSTSSSQTLLFTKITNEVGEATFSIPLTLAFSAKQYSSSFVGELEQYKFDVFSTTLINIHHLHFVNKKDDGSKAAEIAIFPQEKSAQTTYSCPLIFVTLKQIEKPYGFAQKIVKTPAAFGAAARDGPVA